MALWLLALAAFAAEPNAAPHPTATVEVTRAAPVPKSLRFQLRLEATFGDGRFSCILSDCLQHLLAPTLRAPAPVDVTDAGLLAAHIGHGLYLGSPPMPRPSLVTTREWLMATPQLFPNRASLGFGGTLFVTPHLGVRLDASVGPGMFAGLSLVYRPGK